MTPRRSRRSRVILGVAAVALFASILYLANSFLQDMQEKKLHKELKQEAFKSPETSPEGSTEQEDLTPYKEESESNNAMHKNIDFEALYKRNPDVYAWITVPGTKIDYPIVAHPDDNSFYLVHNFDGDYAVHGAIFTEKDNARDFSDPVTVIYGHNMKDGSMFAELHKFEDRGFFDDHKEFTICTPSHTYHYAIFAAYTYSSDHILKKYDYFQTMSAYRKYLDEVYSYESMNDFFRSEPKATVNDRIVTLSTCTNLADNITTRYLVQGILMETE